MPEFIPPRLLRNHHVQSVLASVKVRRPFVQRQAARLTANTTEHILDCNGGVRLHGYHSGHAGDAREDGQPRDLVILIHGWEGSADSLYLLSCATYLYEQGFDVFRLHLRDHGPSHALNEALFNACLIDEVVSGITEIARRFSHRKLFLAGFSMGGNFALRVGLHAPTAGIDLARIIAICPLVNPEKSMAAIENGWFGYRRYFVRKWKRSLNIKARHFPRLLDWHLMDELKTITDMTEFFVAHQTHFADAREYYNGYKVVDGRLAGLTIPTIIYATRDDPIIPVEDMSNLGNSPHLDIRIQSFGGHCGYIEDFRLNCWINGELAREFGA